jgi:3-deoxy-D-manno-octulosonate 8-phosphate phosphatase KdsC-like HAD superfamily phosphatase
MIIYIQITNQIKTDCLKVLTAGGINSARAQKVRNLSKALKIMKKLDAKIAIITGRNSGIGLASAQRFVAGRICFHPRSPA